MISANFRLESDLRGWFNLEPETPHGRFKLDLESPKRRPDSTSRPTPVPKRPRKEVESCDKPAFEDLLFIFCYLTKPKQQITFKGSTSFQPPGPRDQEAKSGDKITQGSLPDARAGFHLRR